MKVLFAGSPAIAVPSLEMLQSMSGVEIAGVLTNPDTPKGRHGTPLPTAVGEAAQKFGITPILKPFKLDSHAREQAAALECDLLVSFAFGRIFGPKFLNLFPLGGINVHPSLLPKYRGPTPVQAAIINRESVTGISIQTLAEQMDSGGILAQEKLHLTGKETTDSLSKTIAVKSAQMLKDVLSLIAEKFKAKQGGGVQGSDMLRAIISGAEQNHSEATYCSLISKEDGVIDWKRSAAEIEAKIRAFTPWPLCRTIHNGRELLILKADVYKGECVNANDKPPGYVLDIDKKSGILIKTGDGVIAATELQYHAKKALLWRDFLNGARGFPGSQLN